MNRWRHRRITFAEALTPEIADGLVYTDNALSPNTTVVISQYSERGTTDIDRLTGCTVSDEDGTIVITGVSTWLVDDVRVPVADAVLTVYVHPNPADCVSCGS